MCVCILCRFDSSPLHSPAQASRPGIHPECNSHRWQCIRRTAASLFYRTGHRWSWWCQQQQACIWGGKVLFKGKLLWFNLDLNKSWGMLYLLCLFSSRLKEKHLKLFKLSSVYLKSFSRLVLLVLCLCYMLCFAAFAVYSRRGGCKLSIIYCPNDRHSWRGNPGLKKWINFFLAKGYMRQLVPLLLSVQ